MRWLFWLLGMGVLLGTTAEAQSNHWRFVGMSPVLGVEGEFEWASQAFVGAEGLLGSRIGYSVEGGYAAFWQNLEGGVGVISAGGVVFPMGIKGNAPFVSAGYTLGFRSQSLNLAHWGLGFTRRGDQRLGTRFEVRDYIFFNGRDPNKHFVSFRLALLF